MENIYLIMFMSVLACIQCYPIMPFQNLSFDVASNIRSFNNSLFTKRSVHNAKNYLIKCARSQNDAFFLLLVVQQPVVLLDLLQ